MSHKEEEKKPKCLNAVLNYRISFAVFAFLPGVGNVRVCVSVCERDSTQSYAVR